MQINFLRTLGALLMAGSMLTSCHSDIDLGNVDTSAEVQMGLVLPVGTINMTMGDFLGNGKVKDIYVDEYGYFHYKNSLTIPTKEYRSIDIRDYIIKDTATLEFPIKEKVAQYGNPIPPLPAAVPIKFDLELGMEGINDNTTDERIDSIWVREAKFTSKINVTPDFDLKWSDIVSVQLVLSDQFRVKTPGATNKITILDKNNRDKYTYGDPIPIDINDFTLSLLKDNADPSKGTVNKIKFSIIFNVKPTSPVSYTDDSKFSYNLQVQLLEYDAIWGFFEAGNQMRNTDTICMADEWEDWQNVKKLKVRFAEPRIDVYISHKVSAPLIMYMDYIQAIDSLGQKQPATWGASESTALYFTNSNEYISPDAKTVGDSVILHRSFSHKTDSGHIDRLFDVRPDSFIYSFHLAVNRTSFHDDEPWRSHKQLRVFNDIKVRGHADIDIPFKFNEGSEMSYTAIASDVDMSRITLDSVLASADILDTVKASDLKLVFVVRNSIPFDIYGKFTFLDKDSTDMNISLVQDNDSNRIHFPAPKMSKGEGDDKYGYVSEPSETALILNVNKNDFDKFAEVKHIRFEASLTDNPLPCRTKETTGISVKIGLTANIDALLNFNKK